jgi:hypothetical protein
VRDAAGPAPSGPEQLFMVEHRLLATSEPELKLVQEVLVEVSQRFTARGVPMRYLGSMFLPRRERLLSLFAAHSIKDVRAANEATLVPYLSIEPVRQIRGHLRRCDDL